MSEEEAKKVHDRGIAYFDQFPIQEQKAEIQKYFETAKAPDALWHMIDTLPPHYESNHGKLKDFLFWAILGLVSNDNMPGIMNYYWKGSPELNESRQKYVKRMLHVLAEFQVYSSEIYGSTMLIDTTKNTCLNFNRLWYNDEFKSKVKLSKLRQSAEQGRGQEPEGNASALVAFDHQADFENVEVHRMSYGKYAFQYYEYRTKGTAPEVPLPLENRILAFYSLIGMLRQTNHVLPAVDPLITTTTFQDIYNLANGNIAGISGLYGNMNLWDDAGLVDQLKGKVKYLEVLFVSNQYKHDSLLKFVEDIAPERINVKLGMRTVSEWSHVILSALGRSGTIEELTLVKEDRSAESADDPNLIEECGLTLCDLDILANCKILNLRFEDATLRAVKDFIDSSIRSMEWLESLKIDYYDYEAAFAENLAGLSLKTLIIDFMPNPAYSGTGKDSKDDVKRLEEVNEKRKEFFERLLRSESIRDFVVLIAYDSTDEYREIIYAIKDQISRHDKGTLTIVYQWHNKAEIMEF